MFFKNLRALKQQLEIVWDLVTQYNQKVKAILIDNLVKKFPTHKFLNLMKLNKLINNIYSNYLPELTNAPIWIIDFIDGTMNFIHSFCHTAMGVVEGYHSDNLIPWDVAAGVYNLIIKEAGGIVIEIQII
ncbi:Inositol monophosphatase 1 [Trachymyrmex zeteki]|uniref:Inositol monophosphatase 1 n=1 Tax=Mycetomoellerius zeteki TaxID=64791 RepID=A0A151XB14_9HYME|nr:Inositol monophosphatase 1 [Trachymyrmex zeteki]